VALIEHLRRTRVQGDASFLQQLDPLRAHEELVDDRFVRQALTEEGGPAVFGLPESLEREELIDP
jgi:NitT/TauT family transport system substrate-binding protein